MTRQTTLCRMLAPEDIRPGIFVSALAQVDRHPVFDPGCMPMRNRTGPAPPVRVDDVALPFVFVSDWTGRACVMDVRDQMFGQVPTRVSMRFWNRLNQSIRSPAPHRASSASRQEHDGTRSSGH